MKVYEVEFLEVKDRKKPCIGYFVVNQDQNETDVNDLIDLIKEDFRRKPVMFNKNGNPVDWPHFAVFMSNYHNILNCYEVAKISDITPLRKKYEKSHYPTKIWNFRDNHIKFIAKN